MPKKTKENDKQEWKVSKSDEEMMSSSASLNPALSQQASDETQNKLTTLKISSESLKREKTQLQQLGYANEDIDLLFRRSSTNGVVKLLQYHKKLIKHFSLHQIIQIASYTGGGENLRATKANVANMKVFGFTTAQIVNMVSHHGGHQNLLTVIKHYSN